MNTMLDIFTGDAFSVQSLTASINVVPTQYGRITEMGLFKGENLTTTKAFIEMENNVLSLIPMSERGTAAPKSKSGKRVMKAFDIPRIALEDMIYPSDIQNVRQFGSQELQTVISKTNDKLVKIARKFDITQEYLSCGAIAGIIYDADGSEYLNLFTEFNVVENDIEFDFTEEDEDIPGKVQNIVGYTEDNLMGDTMVYVHALCSPEFFTGLTTHPKVKEAYQQYMVTQAAAVGLAGRAGNILRDDMRKNFLFKGVMFEEYRGNAQYINADGTVATRKFIEAGCARFFPVGTAESFFQFNAPADWLSTANTVALGRYAKVVPDPGDRWAEILAQANPLPLCVRPKLLSKGTGVYT